MAEVLVVVVAVAAVAGLMRSCILSVSPLTAPYSGVTVGEASFRRESRATVSVIPPPGDAPRAPRGEEVMERGDRTEVVVTHDMIAAGGLRRGRQCSLMRKV